MDDVDPHPAVDRGPQTRARATLTRRDCLLHAAGLPLLGMALTPLLANPAGAQDTQDTETGETAMTLDTEHTALVLLHYQQDIISIFSGAGIDAYVARMTDLAARARAAGLPVFFVKIGFSPDYREVSPNNQNGQMIRSFGLFTTDTIPEGLHQPGDVLLTGHRVSGFKGTSLDIELRARGVDTLIMAGVTTTGVVLSTVAEASDLDYRILLLEDGCFETDTAAHEGLFRTAFATRCEITSSDAVLASL